MIEPGQILQNRYQLKQKLNANLARQTWLAEDLLAQPTQQVIVKLLAFTPQIEWDELKLFEREAQVLKNLNHPRIPRYRDYFSVEYQDNSGLPWFGLIQDYIPGNSLQTLLDQGKVFSEDKAYHLAKDILKILIYLHELSPPVLHRDIKPSNIILGEYKQFYLVDFGAVQDKAKAEGVTFTVVGTSGYAPPEQLWGRAIPASDLYALGATLIYLLAGTPPADLPQNEMQIEFADRVKLRPNFVSWIEQLINPVAEKRFDSARSALEALEDYFLTNIPAENSGKDRNNLINYRRLVLLSLVGTMLGSVTFMIGIMAIIMPFKLHKYQPNVEPELLSRGEDIAAINKAQQTYYRKTGKFVTENTEFGWGSLGLKIKKKTPNYKYIIKGDGQAVFTYAMPRNNKLKSYIGAVFAVPESNKANASITLKSIVCEANSSGEAILAKPIYQNGELICADGTYKI